MRLEAVVARDGGAVVASNVSDLSLDGCCLTGSFLIGERIEVKLPRIGTLVAEIRWALMGRAGARFISSIEQAALGTTATSAPCGT